jgi:transporter family-2 protein
VTADSALEAAPVRKTALPLIAAFASGAMVALQSRFNGDLGDSLNDPLLAAVVSFLTGLLLMIVLVLRRAPRAAFSGLRGVPWWRRLGGLGGATLVAVATTAAPRIGVAILTVALVAGATAAGLLVDHWGLAPGGRRVITGPRVAGAVLCLVAIAISAAEGLRQTGVWLLLLVVIAGAFTAFQQAFNGHVRHATDATVATFVNFVVGTTALLLAFAIQLLLQGPQDGSWPGWDRWYLYLGGVMGATFVALAALVVRSLGVLRLGLAITGGQLIGAILLDLDRGVAATTVVAAGLTMLAVAVSGWRRR